MIDVTLDEKVASLIIFYGMFKIGQFLYHNCTKSIRNVTGISADIGTIT
jgi:hypothetical protein